MTFDAAVAFTIEQEGGAALTDKPGDPGGVTKYGIAQKFHPDVDVASLTLDEAIQIYRKEYWDLCHCDELPSLIQLAVFDGAVNPGPSPSIKFLQRALGVQADGIVGAITIRASQSVGQSHLIKMLTSRILYYSSRDGFQADGAGWVGRCLAVSLASRP